MRNNMSKDTPPTKKFRNVRLEVIEELDHLLEEDRLSAPRGSRLNKSAHIRKILWEYVSKKKNKS